jgi:hypothetical protein
MRKFLIPIAAAGSLLAVAAPASAQIRVQWAPPVYNYQPYNYAYGFNGGSFARAMHQRVERIRNDIRVMQSRRVLSYNEARGLERQAWQLQRRIDRVSRFGINPNEARSVEMGIRNLEIRVSREANDWNRRYGNRGGYRRY